MPINLIAQQGLTKHHTLLIRLRSTLVATMKLSVVLLMCWIPSVSGFLSPYPKTSDVKALKMGIFDSFKKAFANEEVSGMSRRV